MFRYLIPLGLCTLMLTSCSKKPREGVVVLVNGFEILQTEVMQTAEMLRESMIAAFPEKAVEGINTDLLAGAAQQLVANRLLVEEAQKKGITAQSAQIDSGIATLLKRFPDKAAFERELTKMGETDSSFRARIAEGICLDSLMAQVLSGTPSIDTQECRSFYEQNKEQYRSVARMRVGQIFLPFSGEMTDSDRKLLGEKAADIHKQILAGKSFDECARLYSQGPGATEGGDIGWFNYGDLREDLEKPLLPLAKGEISSVIITDIGAHILRKGDVEENAQQPFEAVENRIRMLLEIKARNSVVSRYLDSLTSKAKIQYIDTTLAKKPDLGALGGTLGGIQ